VKLLSIPKDKYDDYRLKVIFKGYKWDPQFFDNNTISKHVLLISARENTELEEYTEKLGRETIKAEQVLNANLNLTDILYLPGQIRKELPQMNNYEADNHVRLMRFDFHPVTDGSWVISEVNSDVPGGFAEASLMPEYASGLFGEKHYKYKNFGKSLAEAIAEKVKPGGKIMLVHCTSFSDDRQVMQFLGDKLEGMGLQVIYAAGDHLTFKDNKAISILDKMQGEVAFISRFTPLEWLIGMKPKRWQGYFNTITPSCNHPIAIFAQTKRFPLVWDKLEKYGLLLSTWRKLLPETIEVKDAKNREGFIFKPACGRVGEGISIKAACRENEYETIIKDVKRHPKKYVAQKMFNSLPLCTEEGESYHVCLGSYFVNNKAAGYYARISKKNRIDSWASDIPVLIEEDTN